VIKASALAMFTSIDVFEAESEISNDLLYSNIQVSRTDYKSDITEPSPGRLIRDETIKVGSKKLG
jgi:hypothetical protein